MHFALHIQRERAAVGVVQRVLRFAVCLVGQLRIVCHRQFVGVAHVHVRRNQRIAVHVYIGRAQHIVIHHNRSRRGFPFAAVRAACVVGAAQVKRVFARAHFNALNQLFFAVADGDEFFAFAADQPWVCHFNFLIVVTAVQVNLGAQVFQRVFLVVLRNQRRIEVAISRRLAVAAFGAVHACNQGARHQAVVFQLVGAVSVHRQRVAVAIRIVFAARGQNRGVAA